MARPKKRSVKEMRAELERLKRDIAASEREASVEGLASSREFKAVARQIARLGLSSKEITELFSQGPKPARKKRAVKARAKVKPKYRHPKDSKLTWTGRGIKPKWVQQALEGGTTLEDLLIKN